MAARIEDGGVACDAVVALHACGAASDLAIEQAVARRAPFIVCPCCVGKVAQRPKGTPTPKGAPKGAPKGDGDAGGGGGALPAGWNNGKGWVEADRSAAGSRAGGSLSPPAHVLKLPRSPWLREQVRARARARARA